MTVPFSELLTSQTSDTFLTDTHEAIEESTEEEVREKPLNLGIEDEIVHMDHDERMGVGGHLSDHNQKPTTIEVVR